MNLSDAQSEAAEFVDASSDDEFESDEAQVVQARESDGQGGRRRSRKRRNRRGNSNANNTNGYRDSEQQQIIQRMGSSRRGWGRPFAVFSDEGPAPPLPPRRGLGRACSYD